MPKQTSIYDAETTFEYGVGWTVITKIEANMNTTATFTSPYDITETADQYGLRHTASIHVVPISGTHATHVVALYVSNGEGIWSELASSTVTGSGIVGGLNIKGYRRIRAAVKTAEGADSVSTIIVVCTNDYR